MVDVDDLRLLLKTARSSARAVAVRVSRCPDMPMSGRGDQPRLQRAATGAFKDEPLTYQVRRRLELVPSRVTPPFEAHRPDPLNRRPFLLKRLCACHRTRSAGGCLPRHGAAPGGGDKFRGYFKVMARCMPMNACGMPPIFASGQKQSIT